MMRCLILILFICATSSTMAQGSLLFCDRVDSSGNAVNSFESLILSPEGQTIQLLFHSENGAIGSAQLKLEIAKLINHSFQKTDLRSIFTDPTKEIVSIPFNLKSAGDYRFRLTNQEGKILAEEILSVSVEMSEVSSKHEVSGSDLHLPDHADLFFSEGNIDNLNTEFSFNGTRGRIKLILQPFDENDPVRLLDLWQSEGDQYKKFIRSEKATFVKVGDSGVYELTFPAMKDYKVDVHNSDNTLITSGFVGFK